MASTEGYDCNFVNEIPQDLTCPVCHFAVRDPIQLGGCGHGMCEVCYEQLKGYAGERGRDLMCPLDRELIDSNQIFSDKGAARRVLNLDVYCTHKKNGCEWTGTVRYLQEHEKTCCMKASDHVQLKSYESLVSQIHDLRRAVKVKEEEVKNCTAVVEKLGSNVSKLEGIVHELSLQLNKYRDETKSTLERLLSQTTTYRWEVPWMNILQGRESSKQFYLASNPFCFQLSAQWLGESSLHIRLHTCRGKNDKTEGHIRITLERFEFEVYIVGSHGQVAIKRNWIGDFNISANYQRSRGVEWNDCLENELPDNWLINNYLHVFCKID